MARLAISLTAALLCVGTASESKTLYAFSPVYELEFLNPSGGSEAVRQRPSLADDGSVAFSEFYASGGQTQQHLLHVSRDGTVRTVASSETGGLSGLGRPGISDDGEHVAFGAVSGPNAGVYRWDADGTTTRIAEDGDNVAEYGTLSGTSCFDLCEVSNDGRVLFRSFSPDGQFWGTGGPATLYAKGDGDTVLGPHAQTNSGLILSQEFDISGGEPDNLLYVGIDQPVQAIVDGTEPDIGTIFYPQITVDEGVFIWAFLNVRPDGFRDVVMRTPVDDLDVVASTQGDFDLIDAVSLNADRKFVFEGSLDTGGSAIYDGAHSIENRVIGKGDVLFGSVVRNFGMNGSGHALNAQGEIGFWVDLTDGTQRIVRATPVRDDLFGFLAQVGMADDGAASMTADIGTPPRSPFDLVFEYQSLTDIGGFLDVQLAGQSIFTAAPDQLTSDGIYRVLGIDPTRFGDRPVELSFLFQGPAGSAFTLDNVSLFDSRSGAELPGLADGGFERGLKDWRVSAEDGASAFARATEYTAPIPLPASGSLFAVALGGLFLRRNSA